MLYFFQQVLNGLHSGALYALLAFGYAMTNGVLHRTNLAYGALFAFSGQTMILVAVYGWYMLWLTLPATLALGIAVAFAYVLLLSYLLARHLFAPLADRSANTIVAATLGILIVLMEVARLAADTRDLWLPPLLATPVVFAERPGFKATLTVIQLLNCSIALATILAAGAVLSGSRFGRAWHAVADDARAAAMCGLDVGAVFRNTIMAGGLIAALAGVLAGLYYGNVSFGSGLVYGLKVLFITAVGGYHAPSRAALGAAAFGMAESLWTGYFPLEWRDAWMFAFLALMLMLRLAGRETVSAV